MKLPVVFFVVKEAEIGRPDPRICPDDVFGDLGFDHTASDLCLRVPKCPLAQWNLALGSFIFFVNREIVSFRASELRLSLLMNGIRCLASFGSRS
jgi:hypothetical protein